MKKRKKDCRKTEQVKNKLKHRIVQEKGYPEAQAKWMVERIEQLMDYMQYGHALIAYKRQDGTFRLATGTLMCYEQTFGRGCSFDLKKIKGGNLIYWDVEAQGWRNLLIENFLEWRPIV